MTKKSVDELVQMLDQFVNNGGGHMNVKMNAKTDDIDIEVIEYKKGLDSCGCNSACQVPTVFIDDDE